jgi:hypothetical protein
MCEIVISNEQIILVSSLVTVAKVVLLHENMYTHRIIENKTDLFRQIVLKKSL